MTQRSQKCLSYLSWPEHCMRMWGKLLQSLPKHNETMFFGWKTFNSDWRLFESQDMRVANIYQRKQQKENTKLRPFYCLFVNHILFLSLLLLLFVECKQWHSCVYIFPVWLMISVLSIGSFWFSFLSFSFFFFFVIFGKGKHLLGKRQNGNQI